MNAYTPYILFIRQIMHIMNNIIFNDLYILFIRQIIIIMIIIYETNYVYYDYYL